MNTNDAIVRAVDMGITNDILANNPLFFVCQHYFLWTVSASWHEIATD